MKGAYIYGYAFKIINGFIQKLKCNMFCVYGFPERQNFKSNFAGISLLSTVMFYGMGEYFPSSKMCFYVKRAYKHFLLKNCHSRSHKFVPAALMLGETQDNSPIFCQITVV